MNSNALTNRMWYRNLKQGDHIFEIEPNDFNWRFPTIQEARKFLQEETKDPSEYQILLYKFIDDPGTMGSEELVDIFPPVQLVEQEKS